MMCQFNQSSLYQTSYFGLGWVRLTTFIIIRKLIPVLIVLMIDLEFDTIFRHIYADQYINSEFQNRIKYQNILSFKYFAIFFIVFTFHHACLFERTWFMRHVLIFLLISLSLSLQHIFLTFVTKVIGM